jgi:hypothetical protein
MAPEYLPRSRRILPSPALAARRTRRRRIALASSPLLLGLCLMIPLMLVFPKALGDGLREGEA